MFTGLIEATGSVIDITPSAGATRITIAAPMVAGRLNTGESVAVNGVCLTALSIEPNAFPPRFSADLAGETIERTTLSQLRKGTVVNLELPTPAGAPMGGHVVQGHVDGTARLLSLEPLRPEALESSDWRLKLELPATLSQFVVSQGSITVEGISLTVAAIHGNVVEIAIIPHTYAVTNLHTLKAGAVVNIETDVLARYAIRRQDAEGFTLTEGYLLANGY